MSRVKDDRMRNVKKFQRLFIITFLFLLSISTVFPSINVTSIFVEVTLDRSGIATVQEKINVRMENELDVVDYNKAAEANTLQAWQKILKNDEVRFHIDLSKVNISDELKINPQPVRSTIDGFASTVLITYKVKEGLFNVSEVKPRLKYYRLIPEALSFKKTEKGSLILKGNIALQINIPENAKVLRVNPLPSNIRDEQDIYNLRSFYFRDIILVDPDFQVAIEQSINEEINDFFENLISTFFLSISSLQGIVYAALIILLIILYIYITSKTMDWYYGTGKK